MDAFDLHQDSYVYFKLSRVTWHLIYLFMYVLVAETLEEFIGHAIHSFAFTLLSISGWFFNKQWDQPTPTQKYSKSGRKFGQLRANIIYHNHGSTLTIGGLDLHSRPLPPPTDWTLIFIDCIALILANCCQVLN